MKKMFALLAVLMIFVFCNAFAQEVISDQNASIKFTCSGPLGSTVEGSFKGIEGSINFKPSELGKAKIIASAKVATVETGINLRNRHLREQKMWFDGTKFPKIEFSSVRINKTSQGYIAEVNLSMKGNTKLISVPFTASDETGKLHMKSKFEIKRDDFKVGEGNIFAGDDITIYLDATINKH